MTQDHTLVFVCNDRSFITGFRCSCGMSGTETELAEHLAIVSLAQKHSVAPVERELDSRGFPPRVAAPLDPPNYEGGDTQVHYLPSPPRAPAPPVPEAEDTQPPPLPPTPPVPPGDESVREGADTWPRGHEVAAPSRSIAEAFQDMLRIAYQAGAASTTTGEIFETWYQRVVLR